MLGSEKSKLFLYEEQTINIGEDTYIDAATEKNNGVVFEDNGETGYFYAVDCSGDETKILDALHIYNVANINDKHIPSIVRILWNEEMTKAFLSINNYYHAIFDFEKKAGYCRNEFPEGNLDWIKVKNRKLTDDLIKELLG